MNRESPRNDPNLFRAPSAEERRTDHELTVTLVGMVSKLFEVLMSGGLFLVRRFLLSRPRGREIITKQNMGRIWFRAFACSVIAWFVGFYVGRYFPGGTLGPWFMAYLFMALGPLFAAL